MVDKNKKKVTVPTVESTQITVPTVAGLKKAAEDAATHARRWSDEKTHAAGDWAKPRIEHGKDVAGPALAAATDAASAKGSELKGKFDERVPKVSGSLASAVAVGTAARHEAARRSADAALVLKGEAKIKPVKKKKKGGLLKSILAGLAVVGATAAAAIWFAKKDSAAKDDPWARPLTDPYVAPTSGRDATIAVDTSEDGSLGSPIGSDDAVVTNDSVDLTAEAFGEVDADAPEDTLTEGEQGPKHD